MSAKPSPSNFRSSPNPIAARTIARFVCRIHSRFRPHEGRSASRPLPSSLLQTRTYDGDRACHQPRIVAGLPEQPIPFRSSGPHSLPRWQVSQAPMRSNQLQSTSRRNCLPAHRSFSAPSLFPSNPAGNDGLGSFLRIAQLLFPSKSDKETGNNRRIHALLGMTGPSLRADRRGMS